MVILTDCSDCKHAPIWHVNSGGPHKRPCVKPGCACVELTDKESV